MKQAVLLIQQSLVFIFLKADQYFVIRNQNRSFHHHAVTCEQFDDLFVAHLFQAVFYVVFLVQPAAGIEEFPPFHTALFLPFLQFGSGRILGFNISFREGNPMFFQPFFLFFSGSALVVAYH